MPPTLVNATTPTKVDRISFVIDHAAANPIHLQCVVRTFVHEVSEEDDDVETLCNPRGIAPGAAQEVLVSEFLWAHGTTGPWNVLKPLERTVKTFALLKDGGAAVSVSNPEMSGSVWIPKIPFINGEQIGASSKVQLRFRISGIPIYTSTGSAVYAGHTAPA